MTDIQAGSAVCSVLNTACSSSMSLMPRLATSASVTCRKLQTQTHQTHLQSNKQQVLKTIHSSIHRSSTDLVQSPRTTCLMPCMHTTEHLVPRRWPGKNGSCGPYWHMALFTGKCRIDQTLLEQVQHNTFEHIDSINVCQCNRQ